MKKVLAAGAVALMALLGGSLPATAAPPVGQICPDGDSGKIDVSGDVTSIVLDAPDGMVITAVCVKAGSANQGLGAEITYYSPGVDSVTLTHTSGKGISHYSVWYGDGGYES
ncbi:hypothetical protein [Arthrobacter sp. S39]|uniref:hypothetical protein n=1 Tax=Arthrobacter sp. S39 TaxID=2509720 RepID=UPI00103783B9|nr:hypothetical protein [Arthrobacter sp. S39]TAP39502.1 hypothetical protein EYS21_22130 [Arthrobacter sp. S39]